VKLHLEAGGGPYRHVCGLKNFRAEDGKYMSLWVSADKKMVRIPKPHWMSQGLSIPIEHVGLLRYGEEQLELCGDCRVGLEKKGKRA
jgi:hypothetical protein